MDEACEVCCTYCIYQCGANELGLHTRTQRAEPGHGSMRRGGRDRRGLILMVWGFLPSWRSQRVGYLRAQPI